MIILAITGPLGSGKSEICDHLAAVHGFAVVSFSSLIQDEIRAAGFRVPPKPWSEWFRRFAQLWGKARREENPDHYIDKMTEWICGVGRPRVVVDSVRLRAELFALMALGAKTVRVSVDDPMHRDAFVEGIHDDVTETDLDGYTCWDHQITAGRGDIVGLLAQVDEIISAQGRE